MVKSLEAGVPTGAVRERPAEDIPWGEAGGDMQIRLRVEKAQEQLRQTNRSVTEIALATGFSSGQYFSTVFARYSGVSPTDFRNGATPVGPSKSRPQARRGAQSLSPEGQQQQTP